jgi:hypothetical protein
MTQLGFIFAVNAFWTSNMKSFLKNAPDKLFHNIPFFAKINNAKDI